MRNRSLTLPAPDVKGKLVDRFWPTVIVGAVIIAILLAMGLGWRRRVRRDSMLRPQGPTPEDLGALRQVCEVMYVATTEHERELERLAIDGLRFPGRGTVTVADAGVLITLAGETDTFVPAADVVGADAATVAIDRVVETGGLIRLAWRIEGAPQRPTVDSYFRALDPADRSPLLAALDAIAPRPTNAQDSSTAAAGDDPESEVKRG